MNRVNKTRFSRVKTQWEILKMRAAYIEAERLIVESASRGVDMTGSDQIFEFTPETSRDTSTEAEELLNAGRRVKDKLDEALENEDYIKAKMFNNILDGLRKQYNRIKNK